MPFFANGREAVVHKYINSLPPASLQNNPNAVLNAIFDHVSSTKGMMIFQRAKIDKAKQILETMHLTPKVILELGTYVGCSAVGWGSMLKEWYGEQAEGKGCKVVSCELEEEFCGIARDIVRLAGLDGVVGVEQGKAESTIRRLYEEGSLGKGSVDVLFIDHWEDAYLSDLKVVEELGLMGKGGVVIADNTDVPGAPEYLEYVRGCERYRCETCGTLTEEEKKEQGKGGRVKPDVLEVSWVL